MKQFLVDTTMLLVLRMPNFVKHKKCRDPIMAYSYLLLVIISLVDFFL